MAEQVSAIVTMTEYQDDGGCHVALRGRLDVRTVADLRLPLHRLIATGSTSASDGPAGPAARSASSPPTSAPGGCCAGPGCTRC